MCDNYPRKCGIYTSKEHKQIEWAYIEALNQLKTHRERPKITKDIEPNNKKRKRLQYDRGQVTQDLEYKMRETKRVWLEFMHHVSQ